MTILDYYKYALLSTASYVRAGELDPADPQYAEKFAQLANDQSDGRLPQSIGRALFDPNLALQGLKQWTIAHYQNQRGQAWYIA